MLRMSKELKCCPFCGGEARLCSFHSQTIETYEEYWVKCKNDCCQTKNFRLKEKAIEQWNTRKPIDRIVAELEQYATSPICKMYKDCPIKQILKQTKGE